MPRQKDLKRIVRSRMKKTGESYTAARAQLVSNPQTQEPPPPAIDYAALAGMSDEKVAAKTGRTWREWTRTLDGDEAHTMPHRDIAAMLHAKYSVGDWWAQMVTVGYERIKNLRDRGQRRGGAYEAGKTRTYPVPVATLFDAWSNAARRRRWLTGVKVGVRTATAPKNTRLQWPDGTVVVAGFAAKGPGKSSVSVVHTKLPDRGAVAKAKEEWSARLDALGSVLARLAGLARKKR
jgi:hypothetical protein